MNNNTNEEKLRILKERLKQIKEKDQPNRSSNNKKPITDSLLNNEPKPLEKKSTSFSWLKYTLIITLIIFSVFYAYNNINLNSENKNLTKEMKEDQESTTDITWKNLNMKGKNIAIIESFKEEELAKAYVNNLAIKGFKCNYFFLPEKSNSTEAIYMVYIGDYENLSETNQWTNNIKGDVKIIDL